MQLYELMKLLWDAQNNPTVCQARRVDVPTTLRTKIKLNLNSLILKHTIIIYVKIFWHLAAIKNSLK